VVWGQVISGPEHASGIVKSLAKAKNTGVHQRGVLGHFRMILNYKKIKKSFKIQASSGELQATSSLT